MYSYGLLSLGDVDKVPIPAVPPSSVDHQERENTDHQQRRVVHLPLVHQRVLLREPLVQSEVQEAPGQRGHHNGPQNDQGGDGRHGGLLPSQASHLAEEQIHGESQVGEGGLEHERVHRLDPRPQEGGEEVLDGALAQEVDRGAHEGRQRRARRQHRRRVGCHVTQLSTQEHSRQQETGEVAEER